MSATVVPYTKLQQVLTDDPKAVDEAVANAATIAADGDPQERARLIAEWHEAMAALAHADQGAAVLSTPENALASRLQTLIEDRATGAGQTETVVPPSTVTTEAGESEAREIAQVKFDNNDLLGWLGTGLVMLFKRDKHAWLPPPDVPEPIPDDAKVALFSDWATGLYGAPVIRDTITRLPRCDVALHLGDTYYSGTSREVHDRLVGEWPTRSGTLSRALNGNHEMYGGGHGYFSALGSFFHQSSSCVALQNAHWLILGLDTGYEDRAIAAGQAEWVKRVIAAAGARKVILCSHHQLFSSLDGQGPKMQAPLLDLLESRRITAWFWGHEHRLILYEPHPTWGFKARCIGHGGFPAFRDKEVGAGGDVYKWIRLRARPHAPEALLFDGPNFWVTEDPQRYSPHGYVYLEFEGDKAWEIYRTPDNIAVGPRREL